MKTRKSFDTDSGNWKAFKTGDPFRSARTKAAELHKQWISMCWGHYSRKHIRPCLQMYVMMKDSQHIMTRSNPEQLCFEDAIHIYTGMK